MEIKQLNKLVFSFLLVFITLSSSSCGDKKAKTISVANTTIEVDVKVPNFNGDSAYHFVNQQVSFGPRVPNTIAHKSCGMYLENKLRSYGAKIYLQEVDLKGYGNKVYESKNIIGSFNPNHPNRIIICAHWDSRHVADHDPDKSKMHSPIDGANDGASGVGVILELARLMKEQPPSLGVDLILFDSEDQGTPSFSDQQYEMESWCLGSQYWSRNPHKAGYRAKYGILLDMVGASDAIFPKENYSMQFAPSVVKKVWGIAAQLGYEHVFTNQRSHPVIDDHYFVNTIAKIPCIDIIHYEPIPGNGFGKFWHTHDDTMDVIDKNTLKIVGDVMTHLIYKNP